MQLRRASRFFGLVFTVATAACFVANAAPGIYVGEGATPLEKTSASELQRYLFAVTRDLSAVEPVAAIPEDAGGFVLGTPDSLPDIGAAWPFGLEVPSQDGYILHATGKGKSARLIIAAPTAIGVQNGVYALLEEWNFGFYLGGDVFPETVPSLADAAEQGLSLSKSPAFAVRGSLPWYNFFDSPTTWELADHKAFIDQLVKMRCNFLGFHTYDFEPFAAYQTEGQLTGGEPLANTSKPTWGTHPMATDEFLAGTGRYFANEHFGAASSFIEDRAESIQAAKDTLREAMNYAKSRGMQVCLGFELRGDALAPGVQARFEARLKALLADYPMLDCVWLWEPEGMGAGPGQQPDPRSPWASYAQRWAEAFGDIEEPQRRTEAARLALFGLQAHDILQAVRPDVRLVMSGWGGDQWLKCTDFYPGMDKILPEDVAFSALDNIRVTPSVSDAYGKLSENRQRWPIVWYEFDGDQWMPQPNLNETSGACRDALEKGCQGLLGIHWRTRAVEEAAGYCAAFAWNPELTVEEFLSRRARLLYGEENAEAMTGYLLRLQGFGYRWVGGNGQAECGTFSWSAGAPERGRELATLGYEMRSLLPEAEFAPFGWFKNLTELPKDISALPKDLSQIPKDIKDMTQDISKGILEEVPGLDEGFLDMLMPVESGVQPTNPLEDLLAYISYVLAFDRAAYLLQPGSGLDTLVERGEMDEAARLIRESGLPDALHTYALRMQNKGELGVLATINTKAWADLRDRTGFDDETLAALIAPQEEHLDDTALIVLADRVIAVCPEDSEDLEATVKARALGETRFETLELEPMGNKTFALAFPEEVLAASSFEYGVEVTSARKTILTWPPDFPSETISANAFTLPVPEAPAAPAPPKVTAPKVKHVLVPERYAVRLEWEAKPGELYTVSRGSEALGMVSDGWFEDTAPPAGAQAEYRIAARNAASGKASVASLRVLVPEFPLPQPPADVRITSRAGRVILGWECDAPAAQRYRVTRYDASHAVSKEIDVNANPGHYVQVSDKLQGEEAYTYTVTAIAPDGKVGQASSRMGIFANEEPVKPMVELSFSNDTFLEGLAELTNQALALGGAGWAELPAQPEWNPEHELTLSVWVNLDDMTGMPVLICKGSWQRAGYFLQILNRQVRFYMAGVDTLDAGRPKPRQWQHITATYGFGEMCIYLDGKCVGRKNVVGTPKPSEEPLLIGRYGDSNDVYFVRGLLDNVAVYDLALTPEEVADLHAKTKESLAGQ